MFNKLNFKTLILIFGGLLVLVILMKVVQHSKGDRNFKGNLFEVDTAKISTITIKSRGSKEELKLVRNGKNWELIKKNKTYKAEKNAVEPMLGELPRIRADHVASLDKSDWAQYQVADTGSTYIKVEQGGKIVADFILGKISFQQNQQTSYVRLNNENTVYAVDGMLAMTFNRNADDLRDKTMVRANNISNISKLEFTYPDSSFSMVKENNAWTINGNRADSSKVVGYLGSIANLSGPELIDDSVVSGNQIFLLKIEGNNFQPIELKAFLADPSNRYVVTSSLNSEGRFSGAKGDLSKRVFVGQNHFVTTSKEDKSKGKKK